MTVPTADLAAIGLGDLLGLLRTADLRRGEILDSTGSTAVVQVETGEVVSGDRLDALAAVDRWNRVDTARATTGYVLEIAEAAFPTCIAHRTEDIVGTPEATFDGRRFAMTLVGAQSAIGAVLGRFEGVGLTQSLERLGRYEASDRSLDALTARQREVLETAFRVGYFEVPREASAADVAAELDIGQSTVVEHLRRAERNLLAGQFDPSVA